MNLEAQRPVDPGQLLPVLEVASGQKIQAGKTLVILDEVRATPRALQAHR